MVSHISQTACRPLDRYHLIPSIMSAERQIVHAYRHLSQHALRAIQFSTPARYTIRERLRRAFRKGNRADFDQKRIDNTLQFLQGAARSRTLEHRVLRSLLHTWYWDPSTHARLNRPRAKGSKTASTEDEIRRAAFDQFNHLVRMLNESMGMCIR